MMKVLFVNLVYGVGSTGKIIADIMNLLKKYGNDVKALYGTGSVSENKDAVKISGDFGYYFHNLMSRFTDHAGLYSWRATRKLIREIQDFRPDIIHLHTLHGFYVNYEMLFRFLKKANIPVVWTLHDCWTFTGHCTHFSQAKCMQWQTECRDCILLHRYPQCYFKGDVKRNYLRKKSAFTGVKNLVITTPSQWLANQVRQSFLQNYPILVIPNGIDRTIFHTRSSNLREKYHLEDKKIILGVANAWNARKGLNDLLLLADRLGSTYQVVLIGLTERQLPDIPSNVLGLLRTANQTELAQWYTAADVFVNPTYEETFGLTTVEAQACGTPVIVYETDGCPETIASGNGLLVTQGDMQALENAVRDVADGRWYANPQKIAQFDKNSVYQKYIKLYNNILDT
jgi:putative glycosyltransferase